jgi:serine/threonine protein kinase
MITQGKHAEVRLYEEQIRVFKTYKDSKFADNEFFALNFLARTGIMNLNPKKETAKTISMDWIKNARAPVLNTAVQRSYFVKQLACYLKHLHNYSLEVFGLYLTHEDLFLDNILICPKTSVLLFIDWGLSKKRATEYPDLASCALGLFNEYPESFISFINEYYQSSKTIDIDQLYFYIAELCQEYREIREKNNIESESLEQRQLNAKKMIQILAG